MVSFVPMTCPSRQIPRGGDVEGCTPFRRRGVLRLRRAVTLQSAIIDKIAISCGGGDDFMVVPWAPILRARKVGRSPRDRRMESRHHGGALGVPAHQLHPSSIRQCRQAGAWPFCLFTCTQLFYCAESVNV